MASVVIAPHRLTALAIVAARGKRRSRDVARFMLDVDLHSAALSRALASGLYRPSLGRCFRIEDPKPRWIYALPFRDRVAQHLLISRTLPGVERRMAPQSYACRVGYGTHRGLRRAIVLSRHRRFVLRVDIQKFFASIDHQIVRRQLDRTTPVEWRWLRDCFIDAELPAGAVEPVAFHFAGDELFTPTSRPHGLPVGSLTSQIWANVYLSPIDHLLASRLGLGDFVRYCDDLLIYADDRERLRDALVVVRERAAKLRLRLHPDKTRLFRTSDPVPFLGFVLRRRGEGVHVRLRQDNVRRMRQRVRAMKIEYAAGGLLPCEVTGRLRAWLAHAQHGHTRSLVEREQKAWVFRRGEVVDDETA